MYQNSSLKVGNNEGSLMTGVKLPNLLGRGERLQVCCEWTSPQCLYQSKTFKQDTGRQQCRLTICIELDELTNSEAAAATPPTVIQNL